MGYDPRTPARQAYHADRCAKGSHQMNRTGFCCFCIHSRKKAKAGKCGCVGCVPKLYKPIVTRRPVR